MKAAIGVIACVVLLAACEGRPPSGFTAVASYNSEDMKHQCSDLSGTFDAPREMVDLLVGRQAKPEPGPSELVAMADSQAEMGHRPKLPERESEPTLLSIVRRPYNNQFSGVWHISREAFMDKLAAVRVNQPMTYEVWREKLLRDGWASHVNDGSRWPYPFALSDLGASYARSLGHIGTRCAKHWTYLRYGNGPGKSQDYEVHLGRNDDGALLLKQVVYNTVSFNVWAGSRQLRTNVANMRWLKAPLIKHDLQPFSALSLSQMPMTSTSTAMPITVPRPDTPAPACTDAVRQLADIDQSVRAMLPKGAEMTAFLPNRLALERSGCAFIPIQIGLKAVSLVDLQAMGSRLLRERLVRDFELRDQREHTQGASGTLQVTVDLRGRTQP